MLSIALCLIALNVIAAAQKPTPSPRPTPERAREIVALLNDARLAAPELGVDTFLKVVESKKVTEPVWRREILEEALRMTDDVKYPIRRKSTYIVLGGVVDTVAGYMTYAYDQNLDAFSLKGRIAKDWLTEDKMRARQIIFQINGDLKLKPLTCGEAMVYEPTELYTSVGAVAKAVFSPTEVAEGVRGLFVLPWIENMQSPSQIAPVMEMLSALQSPPAERQMLVNALERAMSRSFNDDRAFTQVITRDGYRVGSFISNSPDRTDLSAALHELVKKNAGGTRCIESKPPKKGELPLPLMDINTLFPEEQRFSAEDFESAEYSGSIKDKLYIDLESYKRISHLYKTARETKNLSENKNDKTAQLEWQLKITELLYALDSWKASPDETEAEVFNQKAVFYEGVVFEVTDTELKKVVIRAFMRCLDRSPMQKESFIEWLFYQRRFASKNNAEFNELAPEFPNPNFKVIVAANKFLEEPKKEQPKLTPTPSPTPSPTPTPERAREIVALLNDARLAAPELGVDTFLKVVESKKVTDPVWRKEIIDEALRMIDDVQYPMPMRPAYGGKVERNNELLDTEDFVLAVAYGAKLDRLSFRGRVITLLLESDRERAKQMIFQMGGQLGLKPRSCEDALTYGPDGIYTVVGKVAKAVFTEQQIAEGQRALFVAPWIENIESPTQIYYALDLMQQMQGSAAERQILFNAASRAIDRNFKDDRSFTYRWESLASKVGKLVDGEADPLKSDLKNAFRGMLLKNLRGTRCKDNEIKKDEPLPDYIEAANKLFPEKPLTFEDISTTEFSGTAKLTHILKKSSGAKKLRDELLVVRDTQILDNKIVNHDVTDVAWVSRVNEYIDRILSFEGSDNETEAEMLFLRAAFVGGMVSGISPGELRKSIVRKYLRLVAGSRLQKASFIEWRHWITDLERMAPESFYDIASEFPNPNLKVMAAAKKLLEEPKKEEPKPMPTQTPKP